MFTGFGNVRKQQMEIFLAAESKLIELDPIQQLL